MEVLNLGHINYKEAHEIQLDLVSKVYSGEVPETLIVCSHPSVVTLGKKSTPSDLIGWSGETVTIERGGQATYHGPGQVVIYPILDLRTRGQNIAGFLEEMEAAMVDVLDEYDLSGTGNSQRGTPDYTGVWVGPSKIASIGVAVKRWVTYHGLAFNLEHDPLAFSGINPCGFDSDVMTSLEVLKTKKVDRADFENRLTRYLLTRFDSLITSP